MQRSEKFYHDRLYDYLTDHYWVHEEDLEWYTNPAPNKWKFQVPEGPIVILTCDEDGNVIEGVLW